MKSEPDWMRAYRLHSLGVFDKKPMPMWGGNVGEINFDDIYYYMKPMENQGKTWDDVSPDIKRTFDRLGIPEAEKKYLAGVGAQYESEVVYHSLREEWTKLGVVFLDMDSALREYPDIVKEYFGTVVPPEDNKFAALNSAVWSGGSFVYVPEGVHVTVPLQAYFRINTQNMGQFERTLIIADEARTCITWRAAPRRRTPVTRCTAPSWRSSSKKALASGTRRFRTGRRTCTTS